ncbi:MAG: DUF1211 domain-containing protein [Anaerolineae bacterium]|nr:DUF1211 domain-containing protein [Anaerolineae bacterium]NUQ05873.1 DUF1211 domain-containing protein [Anaerolineae bacterium]
MNEPIVDSSQSDEARRRRFSAITTARIETLADGVFAIVMTLLVFDIRVPGADAVAAQGLASALTSVIPNLLSYILSFLILGVLWVGHHNQFFYIKRADRTLLWINIIFLMAIALLPFSAGLLARYGREDRLALIAYDVNLIIGGVLLFFHWWYATRDNHLLNQEVEPRVRRLVVVRILIPPILYFTAALVSLLSIDIAILINVVVPLLYIFPNRVDAIFRRI